MSAIEERIVDRHVLKLLRAMLRAGVMEDGAVTRSDTGTPQGGVISPVPGQRLPAPARPAVGRRAARGAGPLRGRSAGDVPDRAGSRDARWLRSRRSWPSSGLSSSRPRRGSCTCAKEARAWTSSASTTAGCAATRRASRHLTFLARWPSRQAMQHARDRVREITDARRLLLPVEDVVQDLNRFLRGWAGYFRYGNSARPFDKINLHARQPPRAVRRQAPQARPAVRVEGSRLPVPGPPGADQPQRNHRRATTQPAVATGTLNAAGEERRRAVCGRTACTVRWGAGGNQAQSACRAAQAPLAYPTTPPRDGL